MIPGISGLEMVVLAGIGSVAGILGGLLGIGGSIVMIPAMLLLLAAGMARKASTSTRPSR